MEKIAGIVTILTGVIVGSWFIFDLSSRVGVLEKRLHTLIVAPEIVSAGKAVENPVALACADLAKQAADFIARGAFIQTSEVKDVMEKMGCFSVSKK